jgi:hypothetical protein
MLDRLNAVIGSRLASINYRTPLVDRLNRAVEAAMLGRSDASRKDPATGVSYDRRMVLPINPWKMRVSQGAGQSWLAATDTVLAFDTVTGPNFDTANGFNLSTHQYTVQASGGYSITIKTNAQSTAVSPYTQFVELISQNNNSQYVSHSYGFWVTPGAGQRLDIAHNDILYFARGDVLWVIVNANQASSLAVVGTGVVYWSMHLISG